MEGPLLKETEDLGQSLEEVFSLVSSDEAIRSSKEVLEAYGGGENTIAGTIKWAEFSLNNSFVRGGFSRIGAKGMRHIANWREDPAITFITEYAAETGLSAGAMIQGPDGESFFWCVPYTPFDQLDNAPMRVRAVLITEDIFRQVVELFNDAAQLTGAEKRFLFQLVAGLGPSEAAEIDKVSIETKRAHSKKAISKLNCNGQSAVVRLLLGQMIHILYLCEANTARSQIVETFTGDIFGDAVRLSVQRLRSGRLMRYWELGPEDGRPVLLIHGYMFPFVMLNANTALEQLGLKVLAPVRGGYLDDQVNAVAYQDGVLIDQAIEDLLSFIRLKWDGPAPAIGHALGGYYAMLAALRSPDLFSKLAVVSINLLETEKTGRSAVAKFISGLGRLAKHSGLYEVITRQFQRTVFSNERSTRFVLRRLFRDTPPDLDALNGHAGSGPAFEWYQRMHAHSAVGIASDFSLANSSERQKLVDLKTPTTFIHGDIDPVTTIHELRAYVGANPNWSLKTVKGGGHFMPASHAKLVWQEVAEALAN